MSERPAVIGRYQVERLLGEGGMGVLYLAVDPLLERHVALKLLRVDSADLRRRFVREAQSAARIQHPNIVTVYDVGDHDGQLYIAMEYIDGDTLASLIRDNVPFSPIRKLDIIDEIADGLGFAHQRGIIHRDIKPANLMITRSGLVKVLDFGIARVAHKQTGEIDGPTLVGTPAYMAPEQLEGAEADARSDIYAVGLVMYELFSGRRAFAGATTADVLQMVLDARPTPIDQLVPDIDPDLARVVIRAMARLPEDRYADLQAMRKDLARARRRAMQASADDQTIVVGMPAAALFAPPVSVAPPPAPTRDVPPTRVPPPASPAVVATSPAVDSDATILAPVAATVPPALPPLPAAPSSSAPAGTQPPPTVMPTPVPVAPLPAEPAPRLDSGPIPMPLPSMPASVETVVARSAGRSTVDISGRAGAPEGLDAARPAVERRSSPPRDAAPPPAAPLDPSSPPAVPARPSESGVPFAAMPAMATPAVRTRKGLPVVAILGGIALLLLLSVATAFVAVRAIGGAVGGSSLSGLFTRTVEPRVVAEPPATPAEPLSSEPLTSEPSSAATEVALGTGEPPDAVESPDGVQADAPVEARTEPSIEPTITVPPPSRPPPRSFPARPGAEVREARTGGVASSTARDTPPAAVVPDLPVRGPDGAAEPPPREVAPPRQPERPVAPRDEALALVRAYVAARNTSHAAGIRRVWPGVDDTHLRRITSAFSAPLTLGGCTVEAVAVDRAVAVCTLTQPGTTGVYAPDQSLSIRRTFTFDLAEQARGWVIVGLRE